MLIGIVLKVLSLRQIQLGPPTPRAFAKIVADGIGKEVRQWQIRHLIIFFEKLARIGQKVQPPRLFIKSPPWRLVVTEQRGHPNDKILEERVV